MPGERPYVLRQKVNYRGPRRAITLEKTQGPLWSLWFESALLSLSLSFLHFFPCWFRSTDVVCCVCTYELFAGDES